MSFPATCPVALLPMAPLGKKRTSATRAYRGGVLHRMRIVVAVTEVREYDVDISDVVVWTGKEAALYKVFLDTHSSHTQLKYTLNNVLVREAFPEEIVET